MNDRAIGCDSFTDDDWEKDCCVEIWEPFELERSFSHSFEVGALSVIELFDL